MKYHKPLLTPVQWAIIKLIDEGLKNKEIADTLGLTENTVEKYLSGNRDDPRAIFPRLGVRNRTEAAVWYSEGGVSRRSEDLHSGDVSVLAGGADDEMSRRIGTLLREMEETFAAEAPEDMHDYMGKVRHARLYNAIVNGFWDELKPLLVWTLQNNGRRLERSALVHLAELIASFLNGRGYHEERLNLALHSAQAARALGYKMDEGWLRCDAISWTLIEFYKDTTSAREHLDRAIELAEETQNPDMLALARAFMGRTFLLESRIETARAYIRQALDMDASPVIRARVYLAAGDLACAEREYVQAIDQFEQANAANLSFGAGLRRGYALLTLGGVGPAKEQFNALLPKVRTIWQSPHKLALTKLGLARVREIEGDACGAHRLAFEADTLLQRMENTPRLREQKRESKQFLERVQSPLTFQRNGPYLGLTTAS